MPLPVQTTAANSAKVLEAPKSTVQPDVLALKTLHFPDYGVQIKVPQAWFSEEQVSGLRWIARPMKQGRPWPGAYLSLLREDARSSAALGKELTLERYTTQKLEQSARNATRHEVLSTSSVSADGIPAQIWRTEFYGKTHQWQTLSLTMLRGQDGYQLLAAAPKADMPELEAHYRAVFASWKWQGTANVPSAAISD